MKNTLVHKQLCDFPHNRHSIRDFDIIRFDINRISGHLVQRCRRRHERAVDRGDFKIDFAQE